MLVLSRKENESIQIGDDIMVTVIRTNSGSVSIGIDAPKAIKIMRTELVQPDKTNPERP